MGQFTADLYVWRRIVREVLPLAAPFVLGAAGYLLGEQDWKWELAHALTAFLASAIMWANKSPIEPPLAHPSAPMPPANDGGEHTKATDLRVPLILALILGGILAMMFARPVHAATKTSTVATAALEPSNGPSIPELFAFAAEHGLGLSTVVNTTALGLNGNFEALQLGVGVGASWKFNANHDKRFPVEVGLYVAPEVVLAAEKRSSFAALLHVALFKGIGLGLGWDAIAIGGPDPGLHPFHRSHLFLFAGFTPSNATQ